MKKRVRVVLIGVALVGLLLGAGCTNVQPWEREYLADFTMNPERDTLHEVMSDHVYFSREATSGGNGVGGGGCGCN